MKNKLDALIELADRRDTSLYGWLRFLVGLSAGGLTLFVTLHSGGNLTYTQRLLAALSLASVSLGILAGCIALYAELYNVRTLVQKASVLVRQSSRPLAEPAENIFSEPNKWFRRAERICYLSLSLSVLFLAAFGILRLF